MPADISTEATWALTIRGETFEIPAFLNAEWVIEPFSAVAGRYPGNSPPSLRFDEVGGEVGVGPPGTSTTRSAVIGEPLTLDAWVTDDGLGSAGGPRLILNSSKFRGLGTLTFADATPAVEEGKASTTVTFDQPGEDMLHLRVSDGSNDDFQCCWTNGYVHVTVGE